MTINYDLCTYSTDSGKTYCGLGRGSHLYADHFFKQGEPEPEFDKVFQQLEAPGYPATCNKCGLEGTNASLDEHVCQPRNDTPAPRAGESERDEWYTDSQRSTDATIYTRKGNRWIGQVHARYADQIVTEHNSHAVLVEALREALNYIGAESQGEVQDLIRRVLCAS